MMNLHARLRRSALSIVAMLIIATVAGAAPAPTPASIATGTDAFVLRPGVVVDPGLASVFRMRPEGGIDALDLGSGAQRWSSAAADVPLLVFGGWLFALRDPDVPRGTIAISALDRRTGAVAFTTETALPEGTWTGIDDGLGKRFAVRAWYDGAVVRFAWSSTTRQIGGMRSSTTEPDIRQGVFALDVGAESLVATADAAPIERRPDLAPEARVPGLADVQFLAMNDDHVMTSERFADDQTFDKYRWTIAARANGTAVGRFDTFASFAPFGVAGEWLVHELPPHGKRVAGEMVDVPVSVQVVDLRTGRIRWTLPLRDTAYHGPFPP